ncbi:hypothetical protein DPMN_094654 [Dreissena polymorpha]|uniref:Uncharacterized protein n=1 Tax=Dreissena polymorpha TaxID=45954 RepID=A0A9D4L544_DREPO|nr:hypothetical protein DPMN_094654 [Dreissena polymorpha]
MVKADRYVTHVSHLTAGAGGRRTAILDDHILCNVADPYRGSANVRVHEFAHTVHLHGLDSADKQIACSRYQEALLVKLCAAFMDFTTQFGIAQVLWWTALKKNNLIREIVFNKQRVMQNMRIQHPDITRHTLIARFSARGKCWERTLFKQELTLQLASLLMPESLKRPVELRTPDPHEIYYTP